MELTLFDFDGTLTRKDSLPDFIQFCVGKPAYYFGLVRLSPMLITYLLNIITNSQAKQRLLSYFFKGYDSCYFNDLGNNYSLNKIDKILREDAIKKLDWHKKQGHTVVVVSASVDSWLKKWCTKHSLDLIATSLEVKGGLLTGRFLAKNCYGVEKVNRIKQQYKLSDYSLNP